MNRNLSRGFGVSFLLHGSVVCAILIFGKMLPSITPPLVIDFSIEKTCLNKSIEKPRKTPQHIAKEGPPIKKNPVVCPPKLAEKKTSLAEVDKSLVKAPEPKPTTPHKIVAVKRKKRLKVEEAEEKVAVKEDKPKIPPSRTPPEQITASLQESEVKKEAVAPKQAAPPNQMASAPNQAVAPSPKEKYIKANFAYIRDAVVRNTSYPKVARRMGWEGKVLVAFIVRLDGQVEDIRIIQSCGFKALDKNAIQTIQQCAPFPKPPVQAELTLPIVYKLN